MNQAIEGRWIVAWVDTHDKVSQTWPNVSEDAVAIVAALLIVADELETISLAVAEK